MVVFGTGRFLNGVLISPATRDLSGNEILDSIWPTVTQINNMVPQHSRLLRDLVVIEVMGKPFVLTDKGTVRSAETVERYSTEIEAAYSMLGDGSGTIEKIGSSREDLRSHLLGILRDSKVFPLTDDTDIFSCGKLPIY